MGKFVEFFKKIGRGIKKGATKVWNWTKGAVSKVGKILRPVADIAAKVGGSMSALPGKAGAIGTGLAAGGSAVKAITDLLPDSEAKNKINESINKAVDTGQSIVNNGAQVIQRFNDKAQPWISSGVQIANKLADGADKLGLRMNRMPMPRFKLTGRGIPAGFNA